MFIYFHLHYRTVYGEQIGIQFFSDQVVKNQVITLETADGQNWQGNIELKNVSSILYNFVLIKNGKIELHEWGQPRVIQLDTTSHVYLKDQWRARSNEYNAFLSTAFTHSVFSRNESLASLPIKSKNRMIFCLHSAMIAPELVYGVIGNIPALGEWEKPLIMDGADYPFWKIDIPLPKDMKRIEYKYVIIDPKNQTILTWEDGPNRIYSISSEQKPNSQIKITDENFRHAQKTWRGSGVAIPVFSLRSHHGFGIGEFSDLKLMTDWTSDLGMNLIQVLPVNDTIANKTWQDSYPYAAISVFALHPLYINIPQIAPFKTKKHALAYEATKKELNALESVDFERVLDQKFTYLKILFDQEYDQFKGDVEAQNFIATQKDWLLPYAAFCYLRDIYGTCNFGLWPKHAVFSQETINTLCAEDFDDKKALEFYYFIQYHADKQLSNAKDYARSKRVVLKGDLPIGIYRYSCDAWVSPQLYNMDEQAGAPPDDYAELGQNWGFPTYNWDEMSKDGFAWWRKRMQQLSHYFDALRIDHILGFFRIWQIPTAQIEGTMGTFNPRLPYTTEELAQYGIIGDLQRYTLPYITEEILQNTFGDDVETFFDAFFYKEDDGRILFKSGFDTQQKIALFVGQNPKYEKHLKGLLHLLTEVLLLVEVGSNGPLYNPRITLNTTRSYKSLDYAQRERFIKLHNDYFYTRHDAYWKQQAVWKLPAILDASEMLIFGEDLGMIPKSVPGVMRDMNIITLEIQRMPKGNSKYGNVREYPYFSVCSPSCHDMSTIRGWWEADYENAKEYYYNYLQWQGNVPMDCSPNIVQAIVEDHLLSPSIMAIFPIQDLVGMDNNVRKEDALSEQINEPSNTKHYWRYRFHLSLEDLCTHSNLSEKIKNLVLKSGR